MFATLFAEYALAGSKGLRLTPLGRGYITAALDLLGGDVRVVPCFSRRKDIHVLNVCDNCRIDLAGDLAKLVADSNVRPDVSQPKSTTIVSYKIRLRKIKV